METAVLLLAFNRPESTAKVLAAIRAARPLRLYVSVDGPRPGNAGDQARCAQVLEIVSAVDWPCELHTRFDQVNHGCRAGVGLGMDWFFGHESEGIILEDDVIPLPGFFPFCEELLERFRDDRSVASISGSNLISADFRSPESYFFSRYTHVWGWATWRRAWASHDQSMSGWPAWRDAGGLDAIFEHPFPRRFWREQFDAVHEGRLSSWAFPWLFSTWSQGGLSAMPEENQTTNLGFGLDSTHTMHVPRYVRRAPALPLAWPLRHPDSVVRNRHADLVIDREVFDLSFPGSLRYLFRKLAKRARILGSPSKKTVTRALP